MAISALCAQGKGDNLRCIPGNRENVSSLLYGGLCIHWKEFF